MRLALGVRLDAAARARRGTALGGRGVRPRRKPARKGSWMESARRASASARRRGPAARARGARTRRCGSCPSSPRSRVPERRFAYTPVLVMSVQRVPNLPRPSRVRASGGVPLLVEGERVQAVRESWLVEDRWWTERPLRRRYWELVTARGRNLVVFHDLQARRVVHAGRLSGEHGCLERPHMSSCTRTPPTRSSTAPRCPTSSSPAPPSSAYGALALTDHDSLAGAMELAVAARESSVRAIFGAEVTVALPRAMRGPRRSRSRTSRCSCATAAAGATSAGCSRAPTRTRVDVADRRAGPAERAAGAACSSTPTGLVCLTGLREHGIHDEPTARRAARRVRPDAPAGRAAAPLCARRPGAQQGARAARAEARRARPSRPATSTRTRRCARSCRTRSSRSATA